MSLIGLNFATRIVQTEWYLTQKFVNDNVP